ncbi:MAG TPA: hypothetical protein VLE97_11760 [Gaiellaceae bacterium]|nr:hypothetical protein [Gaiellaceae bacterium]
MKPRTKRKPSATSRIVGYRFGGDIEIDQVTKLLERGLRSGVVTQFDSNKSMERGRDVVWFNGPPGKQMRVLRDQVAALVRASGP